MNDERLSEGLRRLTLTRNFLPQAEGSCLVELGRNKGYSNGKCPGQRTPLAHWQEQRLAHRRIRYAAQSDAEP